MDESEIKLHSSYILSSAEFVSLSYAQKMLGHYDYLIEDFRSLMDNDIAQNENIQQYIKKYEEQKEKMFNYNNSFFQTIVASTGHHMSNIHKINIQEEAPHTVEVIIKRHSPNEKYNFKVYIDQFGYDVPSNFYDIFEEILIDLFEKACLELTKNENKLIFNMIELGSNQAYYSLLFHKIMMKHGKIPVNIMVESNTEYLERGYNHFKINSATGKFYNSIIGDINTTKKIPDLHKFLDNGVKLTTLKDVMTKDNIEYLDILHCDIDSSEYDMLMTSKNVFQNKLIDYIFLSTHSLELHKNCKDFLLECGYSVLFEHDDLDTPIGWDILLVMKS